MVHDADELVHATGSAAHGTGQLDCGIEQRVEGSDQVDYDGVQDSMLFTRQCYGSGKHVQGRTRQVTWTECRVFR